MSIEPVRTEADHKATLKEIASLMESDPDIGTPDGDRLDVLVTLVQPRFSIRNSRRVIYGEFD
ncbi:MAG: hypothetical protein WEK74_16145, partial [Hydrogenophaga sp.]